MNKTLTLYILRQLTAAFAFATGAVTFVVLFTQSFRLLSMVLENAATLLVFFELLALSALTFLPLIMPLGLGIAVLFVHHKLATDSELVIMRAAGLNPGQLIAPTLTLAALVAATTFVMTLWITPAANRGLVALQTQLRDSYAVFLSHPGSFNDLAEGLTFYADKRGANGSLKGILIHDIRNPETPVTTMAATGQMVDSGNGQPHMIIFNGRRQEFDRTTGKVAELVFDQYVLDLDSLRRTAHDRLPDTRELPLSALRHPTPDLLRARGPMARFIGELHGRIATPFLSFSYALIGVAAILAGTFNRRGMGGRILAGALFMIVIQAIFMTISGYVGSNEDMAVLLYIAALAPAPLALFLVRAEEIDRRRLPRFLRKALS